MWDKLVAAAQTARIKVQPLLPHCLTCKPLHTAASPAHTVFAYPVSPSGCLSVWGREGGRTHSPGCTALTQLESEVLSARGSLPEQNRTTEEEKKRSCEWRCEWQQDFLSQVASVSPRLMTTLLYLFIYLFEVGGDSTYFQWARVAACVIIIIILRRTRRRRRPFKESRWIICDSEKFPFRLPVL